MKKRLTKIFAHLLHITDSPLPKEWRIFHACSCGVIALFTLLGLAMTLFAAISTVIFLSQWVSYGIQYAPPERMINASVVIDTFIALFSSFGSAALFYALTYLLSSFLPEPTLHITLEETSFKVKRKENKLFIDGYELQEQKIKKIANELYDKELERVLCLLEKGLSDIKNKPKENKKIEQIKKETDPFSQQIAEAAREKEIAKLVEELREIGGEEEEIAQMTGLVEKEKIKILQ